MRIRLKNAANATTDGVTMSTRMTGYTEIKNRNRRFWAFLGPPFYPSRTENSDYAVSANRKSRRGDGEMT